MSAFIFYVTVHLAHKISLSNFSFKKLLKKSKQAESNATETAIDKSVECDKEIESRRAHMGTYEGEPVTWEVDKYNDGYFCRTSDGKLHKKDVSGTLLS